MHRQAATLKGGGPFVFSKCKTVLLFFFPSHFSTNEKWCFDSHSDTNLVYNAVNPVNCHLNAFLERQYSLIRVTNWYILNLRKYIH